MKKASILLAFALLASAGAMPLRAQAQQPADAQNKNDSSPLYRVTVVVRTTKAINYSHSSGATYIGFHGTILMPMAQGEAKVASKRGTTKIEAKFQKLVTATQYGPSYLTYVLWAITPEGRASNLGELVLEGSKGRLDAATDLQAFALIVTAEPYFAVAQPSDVVVMENVVRPDTAGNIGEVDAKFDLLQRGQYTIVTTGSDTPALDPRIPLGLLEARNAVAVAQAAGADHYSKVSFQKAQQLLQQAEADYKQKAGKRQIEMAAREAVETAEDARAIAAKKLEEERLAQERAAAAAREAQAKQQTEAAERAKLEAQLAAERAAREKAEAEAARAAALAQQQAAEQATQKARQETERVALEKAQAESARAAAEAEAEKARQAAAQAEAEKAELRSRLLHQLNLVLQTRDTVRGLIVNMSDVLFDTGRYTLRPEAREKLAKISGIVLAYPGLKLQVEGHTDIVGSDEFNQRLSEQRAASVREYLMDAGVRADSITARGFGKTMPIAPNDTPEGRQRNRRVELVVSGEAIGTPAMDPSAKP